MKNMLLVEDDILIAKAISIRLGSLGYKVSLAHDAQTALKYAETTTPEVIIIDINLPGADGFSIASRLHAMKPSVTTPIIFITASKIIGLRERAEKHGAIAFLEKPFSAAQLTEAIELSYYPKTA